MRSLAAATPLLVMLVGCGASASTDSAGSAATTPETAPAGAEVVVVQNYVFSPMTAAAGSKLRLENRDPEAHNISSDTGLFKSGPFSTKQSAVLDVPNTPGSYPFHCEIHPTMHGTLVVHNP